MAKTKMGVVGCGGRMGRMLVAEIAATEGCTVAGGSEAPGSGYVNQDIGELAGIGRIGIPVGEAVDKLIRDSDVVLEFTSPAATAEHAALAAGLGKAMVIGTTGLSPAQGDVVRAGGARHPDRLGAEYEPRDQCAAQRRRRGGAPARPRLGHRDHGDAPPRQGRRAFGHGAGARARRGGRPRGRRSNEVEQRARDGITGPRRDGDIGFAALRGGDAVGDHHVIFAGDRRTARIHPSHDQPGGLRQGRGARRALGRRPAARALRAEGGARPLSGRAGRRFSSPAGRAPAPWAAAGVNESRQRRSASRIVAASSRRAEGGRKSPIARLCPCEATNRRFDSSGALLEDHPQPERLKPPQPPAAAHADPLDGKGVAGEPDVSLRRRCGS